MKEIEIKIPEYLTLKHYKALDKVYSLENNLQTLHTIASVLDLDVNVVKRWNMGDITNVWKAINEVLEESGKPEFYPIIEFNGVVYGYQPLSKMSLAEYIDIDNLVKDKLNNIEQMLAILYRPITKNNIKGFKFKTKSSLKLIFTKEKTEHLFPYYDVEEYDNEKRKLQAEAFKDFPASVGLGALAFFLGVGNLSLADSLTSTLPNSKKQTKEMMMKEIKAYKNIMGGSTRYMSWESLPSYQQGVKTTFSL